MVWFFITQDVEFVNWLRSRYGGRLPSGEKVPVQNLMVLNGFCHPGPDQWDGSSQRSVISTADLNICADFASRLILRELDHRRIRELQFLGCFGDEFGMVLV